MRVIYLDLTGNFSQRNHLKTKSLWFFEAIRFVRGNTTDPNSSFLSSVLVESEVSDKLMVDSDKVHACETQHS